MAVLICNSLMTWDVEHLFICLFAVCRSSSVRCQLKYFAYFLIELFMFLLLSYKDSLDILGNRCLSDKPFLKYLLLVCGLPSHSLDSVFGRADIFNLFN